MRKVRLVTFRLILHKLSFMKSARRKRDFRALPAALSRICRRSEFKRQRPSNENSKFQLFLTLIKLSGEGIERRGWKGGGRAKEKLVTRRISSEKYFDLSVVMGCECIVQKRIEKRTWRGQ